MSAATKSVVYYKSHSIRKFLQKLSNKQRLQCCLIVTPSSADRKSHNLKHRGGSSDDHFLSNFVDRSMFAISVEAGMRSVQSNITAAYPTIHAVQESLDLARRSGVQVVVGVGSGAAIDLAKAVANILADDGSNDVELVLSPATLGGCIASTSDEPLILSTEEEALLPLWSVSEEWKGSVKQQKLSPTILFDENDLDTNNTSLLLNSSSSSALKPTAHFTHGVISSLVIALDSALYVSEHRDLSTEYSDIINKTIDHAMEALNQQQMLGGNSDCSDQNISKKRHAVSAALYSGKLLNLGSRYSRRSAPISIASALLPPFFPHGNILTYIASMLPGLCATIAEHHTRQSCTGNKYVELENAASRLTAGKSLKQLAEWADQISTAYEIPSMATLAEGAPATSTLLDRMDSNHALLNVADSEDIDYLSEIIQRSLDR